MRDSYQIILDIVGFQKEKNIESIFHLYPVKLFSFACPHCLFHCINMFLFKKREI